MEYGVPVEDSSPRQRGLAWKKIASKIDNFFTSLAEKKIKIVKNVQKKTQTVFRGLWSNFENIYLVYPVIQPHRKDTSGGEGKKREKSGSRFFSHIFSDKHRGANLSWRRSGFFLPVGECGQGLFIILLIFRLMFPSLATLLMYDSKKKVSIFFFFLSRGEKKRQIGLDFPAAEGKLRHQRSNRKRGEWTRNLSNQSNNGGPPHLVFPKKRKEKDKLPFLSLLPARNR